MATEAKLIPRISDACLGGRHAHCPLKPWACACPRGCHSNKPVIVEDADKVMVAAPLGTTVTCPGFTRHHYAKDTGLCTRCGAMCAWFKA